MTNFETESLSKCACLKARTLAKFLKIQEHVHFKVRAQTKILKSDSIQLIIGIHHSSSCMHGLFRHSI